MPEPLPPDLAVALRDARPPLDAFATVHYFSDVASTNDIALTMASGGAPEGTSVLADLQYAGRGRRGRSWFSPPGAGLYLSVIARLGLASPASLITLASGVAVASAIRSTTGLPIELKWPNDVVVGRPWRKLGGILCEVSGVGTRVDAVVVGVGINLRAAAYPPEISGRATSIEVELGRPIDRAPLVVECLAQLRRTIEELRQRHEARILGEWRLLARAGLDGGVVRWRDQSAERRGVARDIDDEGALVVETDGRVERLIAGEVTWDRVSRYRDSLSTPAQRGDPERGGPERGDPERGDCERGAPERDGDPEGAASERGESGGVESGPGDPDVPAALVAPSQIGDYCRHVEDHLTRVNGGHLVRVVGSGFELVRQWATEGVPLSVVCRAIDLKADRHRQGSSGRPLRIEFCEREVREIFAAWRRAVGVPVAGGGVVNAMASALEPPRRPSLLKHLDRVVERLSRVSGRLDLAAPLRETLASVLQNLADVREAARTARGRARHDLTARLGPLDRALMEAARAAAPVDLVAALERDAAQEIASFRGRLAPDAWQRALSVTVDRLLRDRLGLPTVEL